MEEDKYLQVKEEWIEEGEEEKPSPMDGLWGLVVALKQLDWLTREDRVKTVIHLLLALTFARHLPLLLFVMRTSYSTPNRRIPT